MKEKRIIVYLGGMRGILLYFLLNLNQIKKTIFLFDEDYNLNLPQENTYIFKKFENCSKKEKYFLKIKEYKLIKKIFSDYEIDEIYMHDHLRYSEFLLSQNKKIILLEDGFYNYSEEILMKENKRKIKFDIKNKILGGNFITNTKKFGLDDRIKQIYLTGFNKIPDLIKEKVKIFNVKDKYGKLNSKEKESFLNIFRINKNIFEKLKGKKYLLLTQPLSEDGILTEEEKILIYSEILQEYNFKEVIIKIHSREKTNYKNYFKRIEVFDEKFPIEILAFLPLNLKKVVTIYSTAITAFENTTEVEFLGTEINKKLLQKCGIIKFKDGE